MIAAPEVRASWLKYTVRAAKRYPAPHGPRVLDALGTELRREIREAGPLGWLPIERFIDVCTAIRDALGVDGARSFWKTSLHDCIQEPLIRPLAMGGLYLFGRTPEGLYRRTPHAWALVTRHAGELSTDPGLVPGSLWMHVRKLPPVTRKTVLLHMWEGGFVGQAKFVQFTATVDTDDTRLAVGDSDFLIRWYQSA